MQDMGVETQNGDSISYSYTGELGKYTWSKII
jgi:hypothetical protein